jgi:septal ring factor EnvC (AmiA/AmiB activator)
MSNIDSVETAGKRLTQALDALEAAVERRHEADRTEEALASQIHALGTDRSRLAAELDQAAARSRALEATNREVVRRIDSAMETIRAVLVPGDG